MFDDCAAALPPRAGSSFEAGLRELLGSSAPVTVLLRLQVGPVVELAEDFRWHGRRPAPPAAAAAAADAAAAAAGVRVAVAGCC